VFAEGDGFGGGRDARDGAREESAAATAATAATVSSAAFAEEPPLVAIDHPFLFLIRDIRNGSILFMGQVEDPRQGS
jgi:serpin B